MLDKAKLIYSRHCTVWEPPVNGKLSNIRGLPFEEPKVLAKPFLGDIFQEWMRNWFVLYFRESQKKRYLKIDIFFWPVEIRPSISHICEMVFEKLWEETYDLHVLTLLPFLSKCWVIDSVLMWSIKLPEQSLFLAISSKQLGRQGAQQEVIWLTQHCFWLSLISLILIPSWIARMHIYFSDS